MPPGWFFQGQSLLPTPPTCSWIVEPPATLVPAGGVSLVTVREPVGVVVVTLANSPSVVISPRALLTSRPFTFGTTDLGRGPDHPGPPLMLALSVMSTADPALTSVPGPGRARREYGGRARNRRDADTLAHGHLAIVTH